MGPLEDFPGTGAQISCRDVVFYIVEDVNGKIYAILAGGAKYLYGTHGCSAI